MDRRKEKINCGILGYHGRNIGVYLRGCGVGMRDTISWGSEDRGAGRGLEGGGGGFWRFLRDGEPRVAPFKKHSN